MKESFEKPKEVNLGQVLRKEIGGQTQYLVRYFDKDYATNELSTLDF